MKFKKKSAEKIIFFGELLYRKGLIAGRDGNISIRTGPDTLLITASGVHKGLMEARHLIEMDFDGRILSGSMQPSSETMLHVETYRKVPEAGAIIHAHAPWSIAASLSHDFIDLSMLAEGMLLFGKVEVVPLREPGSEELAHMSSDAATRSSVHILKAHGVAAWGKDLMDAFCMVEALEQNIRILGIGKTHF